MLLRSVSAESPSLHMVIWRTSAGPVILLCWSVNGLTRALLSSFLYAVQF
jgi:hypothetical protein